MYDWLGEMIKAAFADGGKDSMVKNAPLLHMAAAFNRLDLVMWLLERGSPPNRQDRYGRTALFFAANRRMARTLMKAGADPRHQDLMNHTPLHAAVKAGRMDVAHALVLARVDLNAQDKRGHTPLHAAALKGRLNCIEHLIHQGANPNACDRKGRHPLFYAVAGGHLSTAQALIKAGADLEVLDDDGTAWITLARMDQIGALQACSTQALEEEAARDWIPNSRPHKRTRYQAPRPVRTYAPIYSNGY